MVDYSALIRPALDPAAGRWLTPDGYDRSWEQHEVQARGHPSWKLERGQNYVEDDEPSYDALCRGDWEKALRLLYEEIPDLRKKAAEDEERGTRFHRVRVVETPLTPYTQWELHALRLQAQAGFPVRVIHADVVRRFETAQQGGLLPDLVAFRGHVLYRVSYTPAGVHDGAVEYTDPALTKTWEVFIQGLYAFGEDIQAYVARYVARLPPPATAPGTCAP